jgi:subtilase family serine protease
MTSVLQGHHRNTENCAAALKYPHPDLKRAIQPILEGLEKRCMFSGGTATLTNGELDVIGGLASNQITINRDETDNTILDVSLNGVSSTFKYADVKLIVATGGSGNDSIITQSNDSTVMTPMKIYGGNGHNYLVGGDGPDTIYGGSGRDKIIGGTTKNKIDGEGGGDLINTQGAPSVVARHRHHQVVDGSGASLGTTDKHTRYIKNDKLKSTVTPIVQAVAGAPVDGAYTPDQIRTAYGLATLDAENDQFPLYTNTGVGQTIVIVGGYVSPNFDNPTLPGDIQTFDSAFGLPLADVRYVQASGQTQQHDPSAELESALDIEWAHAMAPDASIIMVQVDATNGQFFGSDLLLGVQEAANEANQAGGGVVSMSFGTSSEDVQLGKLFDAVFGSKSNRDISWVASAGDDAGDLSTPATSPYVTAVGGTVLQADATGNIVSQTAWLYGGGGVSTFEPIPAYQKGLTINGRAVGTKRMVPDISLIAEARFGAVQVYTGATPVTPSIDVAVSGTSVGAPIFAGMVADLNELRQTQRQSVIGSQLNTQIYAAYHRTPSTTSSTGTLNTFSDIVAGNNTHQAYFGYDLASGLGTPQAQNLIPALAGIVVSDVPFVLNGDEISSLASGALAGNAINVVKSSGNAIIGPLTISLTLNPNNAVGAPQLTGTIVVSRNLDNTFNGVGTVGIVDTITAADGTTTTVTNTYNIRITGKVTVGKNGREHITGNVITIDPNTGAQIRQGTQQIFTATFTG